MVYNTIKRSLNCLFVCAFNHDYICKRMIAARGSPGKDETMAEERRLVSMENYEAGRNEGLPICETDEEHAAAHALHAGIRLPRDDEFIQAAVLFQQLSDSTRLKILWMLVHAELCVYDIAKALDMSAPAVSHHLRSLRQLGIINYRRGGKHVFYTLADNDDACHVRHILKDAFEEQWRG